MIEQCQRRKSKYMTKQFQKKKLPWMGKEIGWDRVEHSGMCQTFSQSHRVSAEGETWDEHREQSHTKLLGQTSSHSGTTEHRVQKKSHRVRAQKQSLRVRAQKEHHREEDAKAITQSEEHAWTPNPDQKEKSAWTLNPDQLERSNQRRNCWSPKLGVKSY